MKLLQRCAWKCRLLLYIGLGNPDIFIQVVVFVVIRLLRKSTRQTFSEPAISFNDLHPISPSRNATVQPLQTTSPHHHSPLQLRRRGIIQLFFLVFCLNCVCYYFTWKLYLQLCFVYFHSILSLRVYCKCKTFQKLWMWTTVACVHDVDNNRSTCQAYKILFLDIYTSIYFMSTAQYKSNTCLCVSTVSLDNGYVYLWCASSNPRPW